MMTPHLQRLIISLRTEDDAHTENAIRALGQLREQAMPAMGSLLNKLEDSSPELEYWLVWALGRLGPQATQAIPALQKRCNHPNMRIRLQAQEAIDRIEGRWKEGQWRV